MLYALMYSHIMLSLKCGLYIISCFCMVKYRLRVVANAGLNMANMHYYQYHMDFECFANDYMLFLFKFTKHSNPACVRACVCMAGPWHMHLTVFPGHIDLCPLSVLSPFSKCRHPFSRCYVVTLVWYHAGGVSHTFQRDKWWSFTYITLPTVAQKKKKEPPCGIHANINLTPNDCMGTLSQLLDILYYCTHRPEWILLNVSETDVKWGRGALLLTRRGSFECNDDERMISSWLYICKRGKRIRSEHVKSFPWHLVEPSIAKGFRSNNVPYLKKERKKKKEEFIGAYFQKKTIANSDLMCPLKCLNSHVYKSTTSVSVA